MRTVTAASALEGTGYDDRLFEFPPALHPTTSSRGSLEPIIDRLFYDQKASWATVRENMAQLALFETSSLAMGADEVVIQFNAARAQRTGGAAGKPNGCFLNAENLPLEQRGIAYADLFVAINPFPILQNHLTGIYPAHTEQSIDLLLPSALKLACGLGRNYAVFYNGPHAGASAPHHAHVQAVRHNKLPVETTLDKMDRADLNARRRDGESIFYLPGALGRTVLAIESQNITCAEEAARAVTEQLPIETGEREPRMNVLVRMMGNGTLRTLIAPRTSPEVELSHSGHSVFHPASLESIGGIVVVSNEQDYTHLVGNVPEVGRIFEITSLGKAAARDCLHDFTLAA